LHQVSANSPWLPEKGKYNIALSTATIDDESVDRKQERVESFVKTEDRIDELIQEIMLLEKKSIKDFRAGKHKAIEDGKLTEDQIKVLEKALMKGIPRNMDISEKHDIIKERALSMANCQRAKRKSV
jgi:predicted DNA binding protein